MDCIFCSIIEGNAPSWGLYEDDVAVAFLDIGQATPGHTLVVPRMHAADIWSLSEDEAASVMRSVHRVAAQLRHALQPLGMNITQSNGPAAWQEVFHYHVHLVPRYADDGMALTWPVKNPPREKLEQYAAKIKASLG